MPCTSDPQIDTKIVKKDLIYGCKYHNRWDMAMAIRRKYYFFRIFCVFALFDLFLWDRRGEGKMKVFQAVRRLLHKKNPAAGMRPGLHLSHENQGQVFILDRL